MASKEMDDLLCLLMAVIVADKRTFAEEIDAFLMEAAELQTTLETDPKWSEAQLLMWYELNKDEVRQQALGPYLKTWLYERVNRLTHIIDKPAVLESMRRIAISDGATHVSERALIVLTARQWMINPLGKRLG